jgi:hypothetical protein
LAPFSTGRNTISVDFAGAGELQQKENKFGDTGLDQPLRRVTTTVGRRQEVETCLSTKMASGRCANGFMDPQALRTLKTRHEDMTVTAAY